MTNSALSRMEQLLAFVDVERLHHPGKTHIAEWARDEIYRQHDEIVKYRKALEAIKRHQAIAGGSLSVKSATWQIADAVLNRFPGIGAAP
jgi:hypothetical protein